MRIYCINLDRSTARLMHMQQVFAKLELSFSRFAAVDGSKIAHTAETSDLTPGELGCMMSHLAIWREIAVDEAPIAAIFEDDIHVSKSLSAFLAALDGADLPGGADLLRLETMGVQVQLQREPVAIFGAVALHDMQSSHFGTAGYLISRACAARLVTIFNENTLTADRIFHEDQMRQFGLRVLQAVPGLVVQDMFSEGALQFGSEIDEMSVTRKAIKLSLPAKVMREARRGVTKLAKAVHWRFSATSTSQMRVKVPFAGDGI